MNNLQIFTIGTSILFGIIILLPIQAYAETIGSIAISLSYSNGDIADYYPVSLKIYQDANIIPYREIESVSGNPFNIVSLPIWHQYKIEAFVNGLHATDDYVNLDQTHEDLDIKLPLSGGMRLNVFYNDGLTPISNATVYVISMDNKTWAHSSTNVNGQTLRFWLEPTVSQPDHYIVNVGIGSHLVYSQSPVFLVPGIPQEIKIVTNWPSIVNNLITVKVLDVNKNSLVSKGDFVIDAFDNNGNKISESQIMRGEAYFGNLKVGDYQFKLIKTSDNSEWGNLNATIDGSKITFTLFENQQIAPLVTPPTSPVTTPPTPTVTPSPSTPITPPVSTPATSQVLTQPTSPNCNCVAFRLDNIQDYWLNNVQSKVIDTFYQKNASQTIGVIANVFGNDSKLTNHVKTELDKIDIAINGWNFEDFTTLNQNQQQQLLEQSKQRISTLFGITPSVFIPPYGKTNDNTFFAMYNNSINFISAIPGITPPMSLKDDIHLLPANVMVEYSSQNSTNDEILSDIKNAIQTDGFAIVTLNFQDYAQNNGTSKVNMPDMAKIQKLGDLIDKIENDGIKIVTIKKIVSEVYPTIQVPSWIKNNAKWWSEGTVSDNEFVQGIQYLIQQGIVKIPQAQQNVVSSHGIPLWIKNNAGWWANGQISDDDFVKGIQYMISNGIIKI